MDEKETVIRKRIEDFKASLKSNRILPVPTDSAITQLISDVEYLLDRVSSLRGNHGSPANKEYRSLRIGHDGMFHITGIRDTILVESVEVSDDTVEFDATRLILHVKCRDTGEVFTKVNAWDEATGDALVGGEPRNLDRTDPDWPYRRVHNCVSNLYIVNRETGQRRPVWEEFKEE